MDVSVAKEYMLGLSTTIKLNEKRIADLEVPRDKWRKRIDAARTGKEEALTLEAEKRVLEFEGKIGVLRSETASLREQLQTMISRLRTLAARERAVDPDLLMQDLLMAAGYNPGDEASLGLEKKFADLEKEAAADAALTALKAKTAGPA
jgi:phage shock protein A